MKTTIFFKFILLLLFISFSFYSCNKEKELKITEERESYTFSKKILLKEANVNGTEENALIDSSVAVISTEIELNIAIPENISQEDLRIFLQNNQSSLNGEILFKLDNEVFYHSIVQSGQETILIGSNGSGGEYSRSTECSYEGLRQCAKKAIYSKTTIGKIICSFEFWACFTEEVADCVETNCIRKAKPVIEFDIEEQNSNTPNQGAGNNNLRFPDNYSGAYYYTVSPIYIYSDLPKYSSNIYFLNGKYYFNSSKTCLLPTGYYFNDSDNSIYQVVNGEIVSINSKPQPPCATCPIELEHYYDTPFDCNGSGEPSL